MACLGLNIVLGYAGQLSLAQAAFWGVGAYTSAILTTRLGMPVWTGMIAAFFVAAFFGVVLGIPTLKLSGHYLAMATIGFGIILQLILINAIWLTKRLRRHHQDSLAVDRLLRTEGPGRLLLRGGGISASLHLGRRPAQGLPRGPRLHGHPGERDGGRDSTGVDTTYYKIMAFALSAGYAGFGGWLFAHSGSHYISPDTFSFEQSVMLLAMAVLGGNGSAIGAIVGAVLLTLLPEVLRFLKDSYMMVYAAGIVVVMIFMPGGIAGLVKSLPGQPAAAGLVDAGHRGGKAGGGSSLCWKRSGKPDLLPAPRSRAVRDRARCCSAVKGLGQALRRPEGGGWGGHGGPAGRDPGTHRTQRFRQDDHPQHAQRPLRSHRRRDRPGRGHRHRAKTPHDYGSRDGEDVPEHSPLRRTQRPRQCADRSTRPVQGRPRRERLPARISEERKRLPCG